MRLLPLIVIHFLQHFFALVHSVIQNRVNERRGCSASTVAVCCLSGGLHSLHRPLEIVNLLHGSSIQILPPSSAPSCSCQYHTVERLLSSSGQSSRESGRPTPSCTTPSDRFHYKHPWSLPAVGCSPSQPAAYSSRWGEELPPVAPSSIPYPRFYFSQANLPKRCKVGGAKTPCQYPKDDC